MSNAVGLKHKLNKKLKLAVGGVKAAKDNVKSIERRRSGSRGKEKGQGGKFKTDGVGSDQEKSEGENSRKRRVKERQFQSEHEGSKREIDRKGRKRSVANWDNRERRKCDDFEVSNRRLSADGRYLGKGNSIKEKRSIDGKSYEAAMYDRKQSPTKGRKSKEGYSVMEKRRTIDNGGRDSNRYDVELSNGKPISRRGGKIYEDDSVKDRKSGKAFRISRIDDSGNNKILERKHPEDLAKSMGVSDGRGRSKAKNSENSLQEKHAKTKLYSTKHAEKRHNRNYEGSLDNSIKKKASGKKGSDDDSVITEDLPRKRKRVIRIDPHDISNKRIDDSTPTKEKMVEEKVELSQNAQFRAIKPSPDILSFVEDNLLGRRRLIELRRSGYNIDLSAPLDNIPFSTSTERERIEENVFRNKLTFFAAAKVSSSFPPADLPEIAFAGRSNVGKSSLLNALTRQWGVVRTSDKPGLTQTINFFNLASKLCLVDLPGYGFAYAKEEVKDAWEELVKEYVSTRAGLKRVCLLIDTKWGMKPRDQELIDLMERSQTKYQIVLTKTDVVFPMDVARRAMQIEESLKTNKSIVNPLMMASSKSGAGIRSLRAVLAKIARFAKT